MVHTKVFVGNLSFKTKREDLAAEFGAAGKVVDANIITRGPRSLGYGFVEMEDEESAQKAVQIMNRKPVDNREINVELAKPRDETREKRPRPAGRGRGGRGGRGRGGRGGRGRGGYPGSGDRHEGDSSPASTPEAATTTVATTTTITAPAGEAKTTDDKTGKPRRNRPRGNRRYPGRRFSNRREFPPRKESETSLFIANLPFSIDNAALSALYKEYNVKSAHVVLNRNGKSKGFGFVELNSQEQQKVALEATHNKQVEGRALIVKIALTAVPTEQPKSETPADVKPVKAEGETKTEEPKKN